MGGGCAMGREVDSHSATSPHGVPSPSGTILGKSSSFWNRCVWHQGKNYSCVVPSSTCLLSSLTLCPPPGSGWLFASPAHTGSLLQHREGLPGWVNILLAYICSSLKGHGWQEKRFTYYKFWNEINFKVFLIVRTVHSHGKKKSTYTEKS